MCNFLGVPAPGYPLNVTQFILRYVIDTPMFNFLHNIIMLNNSLKPLKFALAAFFENYSQFLTDASFSDQEFLDSLRLLEKINYDYIFRIEKFLEDNNNE